MNHCETSSEFLDRFEQIMESGLLKVCGMESLLASDDITGKWDEFIKDYVADGVGNFNEWPEVALAWAGYLGAAVAHQWDEDWQMHSRDTYGSYYGPNGFDDMDEHIVRDILGLESGGEAAGKLTSALQNCAASLLGLYRHQNIEINTEEGFYILVRSFGVMYRIGAALELSRLGYHNELIYGNPGQNTVYRS